MNKVLFAIYDKVSKTFGPLNSGINQEVVKRNIRLTILNDSAISASISDYSLHFFGEFNERTGDITLFSVDDVVVVPFADILEMSSLSDLLEVSCDV